MPVENSSRKTIGMSTMNIFATCTRRRKPPLRSCTFWPASVLEAEALDAPGRRARRTRHRPIGRESARTSAGCPARVRRSSAACSWITTAISAARRAPRRRRRSPRTLTRPEVGRRASSVCAASSSCRRRSDRAARRSSRGATVKARVRRPRGLRCCAGSIHLDELIDRDGDVAHEESVYEAAMPRTCSEVIP